MPLALETALVLLTAHLLADYVLQTRWMVENKTRPAVFAGHVALVLGASLIALGGAPAVALAVALAHAAIDAVKVWALPASLRNRLWAYLGDQALHLATIAAAAWLAPDAFATGLWAAAPDALWPALVLLCGLILTTLAAGPVVAALMMPFIDGAPTDALPDAGRMIGLLERAMIFFMVLVGEPTGIGFLIAAKSILRFNAASETHKASEYVIIGTLASFGLALALSHLTHLGLDGLAHLAPAGPSP